MTPQTVFCQKCGTSIEITTALTEQIRNQISQELEAASRSKEEALARDREALASRERALAEKEACITDQVNRALEAERIHLVETEAARLRKEYELRLTTSEKELAEKGAKLAEAEKRELELARRERELGEHQIRLQLEAEERLKAERERLLEEGKKLALQEHENTVWQLQAELKEKSDRLQQVRASEAEMQKKARLLEEKEHDLELQVSRALEAERSKIRAEAEERVRTTAELREKELLSALEETRLSLDQAQSHELALRKKQYEVEERERGLELEIQRRLDARHAEEQARLEQSRQTIVEEALRQAKEEAAVPLQQKDLQIQRLNEKIAQLQKSAELGSQELQGEALEENVKRILVEGSLFDAVEDIAKGVHGADLQQTVRNASFQACGTILWEVKNAQNWSEKWVEKLKKDQLAANADIAVIVTAALPRGVSGFTLYDGSVWVTNLSSVAGLACALRHALLRVANERTAAEGRDAKMEALYRFLTSTEFKLHTQALIRSAEGMLEDLDTEERAMTRIWKRRRKQIQMLLDSSVRMVGSFEGIISQPLLEGNILELEQLAEAVEIE